ncbi:MAG: AbrB/MazE/SpoVT family DNA-binding domain-containing protein [bacterium]|nr:AbrB/MazE/SpoVT family DNA-binding domain-containing protein [bacterium]
MAQKIIKVGNSAAVIIPKKSLKELGIKIGDEVIVRVDSKARKIRISSASKLSRKD